MKNRKGLSLIELIVALALFSTVLMTAYSLLFTGLRVFTINSASFSDQQAMRMVLTSVTADARGSDTAPYIDGDGALIVDGHEYLFDAEERSVLRDGTVIAENIDAFAFTYDTDDGVLTIAITGGNDGDTYASEFHYRD